jgi:hypothetical protein
VTAGSWLLRAGILFNLTIHLRIDVNNMLSKARSSAGEHFPDTEGVGGSIPPVPTNPLPLADAL